MKIDFVWIAIAVGAYFINAGVYVADKFLLSKKIHSSIVYAFYVGIWSIFNFVLLFYAPWVPSFRELSIDLLAGLLFLGTLIFWYKALHQSEATRVVPIVGALTPIFSYLLSYIFLGDTLSERQLLAFLILIYGGILVSVKKTRFYKIKEMGEKIRSVFGDMLGGIHAQFRPAQRLALNSTISALFFAGYFVLIKYIYMNQPFIGGFVWSRLGTFLGVILIFFVPGWRKMIAGHQEHARAPKNLFFFLAIRLLAAAAFIILNWAVSKANVSLINSLQGAQYVFLFLLVMFLSAKHPKIMEEEMGGGVMLQKIIGMLLVVTGLYMLIT